MNKRNNTEPLHNFAKYSSMAMQMMVIICLFCFAGYKCDQWTGWRFPLFTILLSLSGVCIGIYVSVKDFLQKKDKK